MARWAQPALRERRAELAGARGPARARRPVVVVALAVAFSFVFSVPAARGNDIGDAVDFAQKHLNRRALRGYESEWERRSKHGAIGMLSSRDVEHGKSLLAYDCLDSQIDTLPAIRSSSKEKAALRGCLEERFARGHLRGYRTLGTVRLDEIGLASLIEERAAQFEVPAVVINNIMMLGSGYRPHAISDAGHVGLMQVRADLLAQYGIPHGDLMDPYENLRAGAAYLRALVFRFGGIRKALLAYDDGGADMTYNERRKRWFVNFIVDSYKGVNRKFPNKLGAENMAFVWSWLD